jgi:hypothetical protein
LTRHLRSLLSGYLVVDVVEVFSSGYDGSVMGAQWWGADLVVEVGGHHGCSLRLQA